MPSDHDYIKRTSETLHDVSGEVIELLQQRGDTVGVAESLTGGGIMSALTSTDGASAAFRGGVVCYATKLKQRLLSVDANVLSQHGAVHGDVAQQMAAGARVITAIDGIPTTWGISTTGVAGPDTLNDKPVGMVFIGIASVEGSQAWGPFQFHGSPDQVRDATVLEALVRLRETLQNGKVSKTN